MKWILMWFAVMPNMSIASGSAEFETLEACYAAQKQLGSMSNEFTLGGQRSPDLETGCFNSATGERKTSIAPRRRP